jgi:hypothetical protein
MLKARHAKEVVLRLPNEIGTLNGIAKTLADKGFNILAVSAWVEGSEVVIRLLVDDTSRAADTLKAHNYKVREVDVVITEVPHKPGMLRHITDRLAQDEIDIHHLYATSAGDQDRSLVVFATAHNDKAIVRLNAPDRTGQA